MATWQFDFHFLPANRVARHAGGAPVIIPEDDFERHDWWSKSQPGAEFEAEIGCILPRLESWSPQVQRWGSDDGNRIDLVRDTTGVNDIFVRIDARRISLQFVTNIVSIARRHRFVLRLPNGRVVRASVGRLVSEIRSSNAFRFSEDPKGFIESLEAKTRDE